MTNLNNELSVDELEAVSGGADALNIDLGLVKIKAVFDGEWQRLRCAVFWAKAKFTSAVDAQSNRPRRRSNDEAASVGGSFVAWRQLRGAPF